MADLYQQVQKLQRRVEQLEREKAAMRRAKDIPFIESLKERLEGSNLNANGTAAVNDSNIDTIATDSAGDTVSVLDYPDLFLQVTFDEVTYNLPHYNNI